MNSSQCQTIVNASPSKRTAARVKISSTDHIGLLAHDIFNVSIPKHHIPSTEYVFQHGPAENDPTYGAGANPNAGSSSVWGVVDADGDGDVPISKDEAAAWGAGGGGVNDGDGDGAIGTWARVDGGEVLGGENGIVEFTVVG